MGPMSREFHELLACARAGRQDAFADLWHQYSPAVCGYLRGQGASDPQETTSDVFLAVFRQLDRFEGDEGAFRALLYTVARRRLIDDYRARGRRPLQTSWEVQDDDRTTDSAEETAMKMLGSDDAYDALAVLTSDQRDVLALRIFADLTVEQVSAVVGKPAGAVKALQRRGLEALRKRLDTAAMGVAVVQRKGA